MREFFWDFTNLYNNRMVYPDEPEFVTNAENGEANNYILRDSILFDKVLKKGGVRGIFRQRADELDNVVCESQILSLKNIPIKRITFIGFCAWGSFKEKFKLEFVDGTTGFAKVYFSNVTWPLEKSMECSYRVGRDLYLDGCRYFYEMKLKSGKGYMYYYTTEFQESKKAKKIIFPDNCLMHIFAITIEN